MAFNCDKCNEPCINNGAIGNDNMQEQWRTLVAQALCGLVGNTPGVAASTLLPQVVKTAAQLTSSYATYANTGFLDSTGKLREFKVINNTDADIEFSIDGGVTTNFRAVANAVSPYSFGNLTITPITNFMMRKSGTASLGSVYLEGSY